MIFDSMDFSMILQHLDVSTVLLISAVTAFILIYIFSNNNNKYKNLPPGPPGLPIFGHLLRLMKCDTMFKDLAEMSKGYGKVMRVQVGTHDVYVLNGYDVMKEAMIEKSDCFSERPRWLNSVHDFNRHKGGIFFHEDWRQRRRFTLVSMRDFGLGKTSLEERMVEEAGYLMEELTKREGKPIDPTTILPFTATNIICSIIIGNRFQYDDPEFTHLMNCINTVSRGTALINLRNFVPILSYMSTSGDKVVLAAVHDLLATCARWMKEHAEGFDPDNIRDLVDLFVAENKKEDTKLVDQDLVMLIFELFFAGTETTSTTLSWALLHLIHDTKIQDRCRQEIKEAIGMDRPPVFADSKNTPYINAVINEVQRIANIVPLSIWHCAAVDAELAGYDIPKGSIVMMNLATALRDPKYWKDPNTFNPDRWLDEDSKIIKNPAFIPFSTGKRVCLGEQLAKKELYIMLASMLQKFQFTMVDKSSPPSLDGLGNSIHVPGNYQLNATRV